MSLSIKGELVRMLPKQSGESARGTWERGGFIMKTQEQYPKDVCISVWGDKLREVEQYKEGTLVEVFVNIESREYNERWYTDVRMWRIQPLGQEVPQSQPQAGYGYGAPAAPNYNAPMPGMNDAPGTNQQMQQPVNAPTFNATSTPINTDDSDDLPF